MGFFGKLFGGGGGTRKPPAWARDAFGDDGARFDAFAEVVAAVLEARGFPVGAGDVRSGSVMIEDERGKRREWIFHTAAAACATQAPAGWREIVEKSFRGDDGAAAAAAPGAKKAWVIATAAWGGLLFECGAKEMLLVLLPITERAPLDAVPPMPRGLIKEIIVCNGGDGGHLAATAIARAVGVARVHAIDPARPVDRGGGAGGKSIEVRALDTLELGPLRVRRRDRSVHGTWTGGITFLAGDAIPMSLVAELAPSNVVGMLVMDDVDLERLVAAADRIQRVLVVANVPGPDVRALTRLLATTGLPVEVANQGPASPAGPVRAPAPAAASGESRRLRVLAHMIRGELDLAQAIAIDAIAAGDEVSDMVHQRAMIALMRGDEAAAEALLANLDTPQAMTSRAVLLGKRGDDGARALARRAVELLPEDAIAIRAAIQVHALAGDPAGARALLASHGAHLDAEIRAALDRAIDEPAKAWGAHRFPEHAQLVLDAVKPMLDDKRFDVAEPLLRRAAAWDPENIGITAELGFALSQQKRDDDAIAVYDQAIARGGSAILLRYNRANCQLRAQRFAEAAVDLRACLELKADWHEARVNLVSALFAAGDVAGARAQIAELKTRGGPAQHIAALERMLAGKL